MTELFAQARVALADPQTVIDAVCEHMTGHGAELAAGDGGRVLRFANAVARFSRDGDAAVIDVSAPAAEGIYFIRMVIASHILEFAGNPSPVIVWKGDGGDIARPPNFRILTVRGVRDITPHMRRITFSGENLALFASMDTLHLNILLQHPGLDAPQWPGVGPNGLMEWQDIRKRPSMRKYTVRAIDLAAGTLDIDFVLHADAGPGSAFAASARPGDLLGIIGPGGGGLVAADWYLFAGDETALPAIARMLEHLPQGACGKALIEVANEAEIQPLRSASAVEIEWLCRNGAAAGTTQILVDAVRRTSFPEGAGSRYIWTGCEFGAFRAIRAIIRNERSLGKHEHLLVSYWRRGEGAE